MRILMFTAEGNVGGGKTHILSLAAELSKRCDFRLVCFRKGQLPDDAVKLGIDTVVVDEAKGYSYAFKEAEKQYKEFNPDIIHCHGSKSNLIGTVLKKRCGALIMSTVHSDPTLDYMGKGYKKYTFGNINLWALKHMDFLEPVTDRMQATITAQGYDPCRMLTIYNGLSFEGSSDEPRRQKEKNETITVGILARLAPVKDIATTLKAFAYAYSKDNRLRLSIGGGGDEKPALAALAKELGIDDVTVFEGWITDPTGYFNKVDINVLSSISETFPYSLLEGAYNHCPAIASNVGGIPKLIEHGKTGYLFEPGDYKRFGELLLKLSENEELRSRLAENLYFKAKNEFSVQRMAERQLEIYTAFIRRSKRTGRSGAVLCGAYGRGNAGDEAIMTAIVSELRHTDPDMPIWVMSRNPENSSVKGKLRSFHIFNIFKLFKALKQAELFVSGGGTLIQDVTSTRSLKYYLFTLKAAKKRGCRVIMYGCGIGPIASDSNRRSAAKVLNDCVDIITLRDSSSLELVHEIGVTEPEIILSADPTLNLPRQSEGEVDMQLENAGLADKKMACFTIREWKDLKSTEPFEKAAEYVREKYGLVPVFIAFESPRDDEITIRTANACGAEYITGFSDNSASLMGMLGRMEFVCGMRLHSLIFAVAAGTPVIGVSYDPKVSGFIRDIGSNASIEAQNLDFDTLKRHIDKILSIGRAGGEEIRSRMQSLERLNEESAAKLLKEKLQ